MSSFVGGRSCRQLSAALFLAGKPDSCPENCCHLALGKVLIVRKGRSDELIISASNICFINLHFSKSSGALFLVGNPNCPGNCGHLAVGKGIGGKAASNELIISASNCFNSFFFFFKWSRGEDTQHHLKLQSGIKLIICKSRFLGNFDSRIPRMRILKKYYFEERFGSCLPFSEFSYNSLDLSLPPEWTLGCKKCLGEGNNLICY